MSPSGAGRAGTLRTPLSSHLTAMRTRGCFCAQANPSGWRIAAPASAAPLAAGASEPLALGEHGNNAVAFPGAVRRLAKRRQHVPPGTKAAAKWFEVSNR